MYIQLIKIIILLPKVENSQLCRDDPEWNKNDTYNYKLVGFDNDDSD